MNKDSKLVLHHVPEARSMRTLWLLEELGLKFELKSYGFGSDLRTTEYLSIHPLGRVPSLEIDNIVHYESGAITEYLCESIEDTALFRGPGTKERYQWLQWLHYSETITVHAANLTQQFIALNSPELRSPTVIKLETRRLEKALEIVETALDNQQYLLPSGFSAADISIGYSLHIARLFTDLGQFPNIQIYYTHLCSRPALQKSIPAKNNPHRFYLQDSYRLEDLSV